MGLKTAPSEINTVQLRQCEFIYCCIAVGELEP